jgi:hypothetical protein
MPPSLYVNWHNVVKGNVAIEEGNCEDCGLICGELGLGATVLAVLQYPLVLFTPRVVAAARVGGA